MMGKRVISRGLGIVLCGVCAWIYSQSQPGRDAHPDFQPSFPMSARAQADKPPTAAAPPATIDTPESAARAYCQGCHSFPEPELLDKKSWNRGAMRRMAVWLGVAQLDLDQRPDGELLKAAKVLPTAPILPEEHWRLVNQYYLENAPDDPVAIPDRPSPHLTVRNFKVKRLFRRNDLPRTSLLKIDENSHKLWVGDANANTLARYNPSGQLEQRITLPSPPVRMTHHQAGWHLTLIGRILPSDELAGAVGWLPTGTNKFQPQIEELRRPTDSVLADLNQDGLEDVVVCQFGNRLGRLSWFETRKDNTPLEHVLIERPGAVKAYVHDANQDDRPDILVLTAQGQEGVYLLLNQGEGVFKQRVLIEKHPAFGYAHFELVDLNADGHLDLVTANGDNGDYTSRPKSYHGIRIYLNDGKFQFTQSWSYPLNGAYMVRVADFDGDGDLDMAATSFFPDYARRSRETFVLFENTGSLKFKPHTLPESLDGRWLTLDSGDLDGDGDIDIALGSFLPGPTTVPLPAGLRNRWQRHRVSVLILENTLKDK